MIISIQNPSQADIKKWGVLAYLTESERKSFMELPAGVNKQRLRNIEREVSDLKKKQRARW